MAPRKEEVAGVPAVAGSSNNLPITTQDALNGYAFIDQNALAVMRENLGGQNMSPSDFERIKFPAGGGQSWELFGLDGESETVKSIDGIVLMYKMSRNYWASEFTGDNAPPDCCSRDLLTGRGNPGGLCATCPLAQWESGKNGGQACKMSGQLIVLRPGESLPVIVPVPVASVGIVKKFMLSLASKKIKYSNAVIGIGLSQDANKGGIKFSKIKPRLISVLPDEAKTQIDKFIATFKESLEKVTVTRDQVSDTAQ